MSDRQAAPSDENGPSQGRLVPAARNVPATRDPYGDVGAYMGGASDAPEDFGFDLREYWRIFYKRRWVVLGEIGRAHV